MCDVAFGGVKKNVGSVVESFNGGKLEGGGGNIGWNFGVGGGISDWFSWDDK